MGDIKKVGKVVGTLGGFAVGGPLGAKLGGDVLGGKSLKKSVKGLTGRTEQINNVPEDVGPLRDQLISALMSGLPGFTNSAFGYGQSAAGYQGPPAALIDPYRDLFKTTRVDAMEQAKESAGNLTGSGYNNILGDATARSLAEENATLAGLGLQFSEFQQRNNEQFLRLLLGLTLDKAQVGY